MGETVSSPFIQVIAAPEINHAPVATNVQIQGFTLQEVPIGHVLSVYYEFSDADGDLPGEAKYQWYRERLDNDIQEVAIEGATGYQCIVRDIDAGYILRAEVTPVDSRGMEGSAEKLHRVFIPMPLN